ncbi:MAG: hypothetical protein ACAI35_12170 [Candidatus Methylacidiphilales bacterium]|nr:hypothetical protein [Candidatus Methylacidiphilales bacterium]
MKRIFAILAATATVSASILFTAGQGRVMAQSAAPPVPARASTAPAAATHGVSVYICGHSFHQFIDTPLAMLAKEAGFADHKTAGKFFVGGSRPIQIWNTPDGKNPTRTALKAGNIDILTLSPHVEMPDKGIDLFADYALTHNPNIRVMLQISWPLFLASPSTDWISVRAAFKSYMSAANAQIGNINRRHGKAYVSLVPVADAVFKLHTDIEAGTAPEIRTFRQIFSDDAGHAASPLQNLVTFCWFAAIYNKSPEGLTSLDAPRTSTSAATNRYLQKLAWDVVHGAPVAPAPAPKS